MAGRLDVIVVVYDLDAHNLALLRDHRLSSALNHDLRVDLRRTGQLIIMHAQVAAGGRAGLAGPRRRGHAG